MRCAHGRDRSVLGSLLVGALVLAGLELGQFGFELGDAGEGDAVSEGHAFHYALGVTDVQLVRCVFGVGGTRNSLAGRGEAVQSLGCGSGVQAHACTIELVRQYRPRQ